MDEKKKQKLLKLARVADRGELGLLEYLHDIEEKIEDAIPNFTELLKRIKGDKGDSPSKEELLDLITPLIPQPENGKTPTKQELLDLITPLIPKVKDGKSPTKEDLLKIIKPLIPKISTEEIKQDVYDELSEEVKSLIPNRLEIEKGIKESIIEELPKMGEVFRDGLEKLEEDNRLDISSLKGWAKTEEGILNRAVSIVDNRTSFLINKVSNLSEKVDNINPVETQDLQAVTDLGATTTNDITANSFITSGSLELYNGAYSFKAQTTSTGGLVVGITDGNARGLDSIEISAYKADATSVASGERAILIGSGIASGYASMCLGFGWATDTNATSIGGGIASGNSSIAISGTASDASSISIGAGSDCSGVAALAIGSFAIATGFRAIALGGITRNDGDRSIAIGNNILNTDDDTIALGTGSSTDEAVRNPIQCFITENLVHFTRNTQVYNSTVTSEMIRDGNFSSSFKWTRQSGWTISFGRLRASNVTTGTAYQTSANMESPVVAGRKYTVTYKCTSYTTGSFRVSVGGVDLTTRSSTGTFTEVITATSSDTDFVFSAVSQPLTAQFDDASMIEVVEATLKVQTAILPYASDGCSLGSSSLMFSDLFLANGGVINFNNGNYTLTHSTGKLTFSGEVELDGDLNHDGSNIGFFGTAPTTQQTALTAQLTSITHTAPTTPDYAIQDFVDVAGDGSEGFSFKDKDEANTVLSVILNLQTRVQELEDKIKAYGLLN